MGGGVVAFSGRETDSGSGTSAHLQASESGTVQRSSSQATLEKRNNHTFSDKQVVSNYGVRRSLRNTLTSQPRRVTLSDNDC